MINYCQECGREVNDDVKICANCKSQIWKIRFSKFLKSAQKEATNVINVVSETSDKIYEDLSEEIEDLQEKQLYNNIIKKEKQIKKLEAELDLLEKELVDKLTDKNNKKK